MKVFEHEHPLTLIDLQVEYPPYDDEEEEEEEGGDRTKKEAFQGVPCKRCGEEIHMYHRYYYKCTSSTCDFSLHKYCGELPERLDRTFHPHPLIIRQEYDDWKCNICQSSHKRGEVCYRCSTCYKWFMDVKCALEVGKTMINHPCHPHLLIWVTTKPILCYCNACGKEHKGMFYQCTTCNYPFTIHSDCAFLPKTLLIQQTSHSAFHHTHPLTLSYSFPEEERRARHYPRCRVCGQGFYGMDDLWIYKCDECMYYAHLDCATSTREPFMSILMPPGPGLVKKNYKDADHPHLLHLPFPDETYSVPRHFLLQQEKRDYEVTLKHASHPQHPLILIDQTHESNGQTSSSSLVTCHDPMKKTQLLCNGCLRPITATMPFYMCPHPVCNFALHEWCTRLPPKIEKHPHHPQHPLLLKFPNALPRFFGVFYCAVCRLACNGFAYCCEECDNYSVDVTCGFIPPKITHKAHPNHLLSLVQENPSNRDKSCHMCRYTVGPVRYPLIYKCNHCDIFMHPPCALLLVETIRHKYDKHPMHLSYLPIENHKSPYFCEICEEDLDPHESFYHCQPCVQSVHAACAPLILQSETETYGYYAWIGYYLRSETETYGYYPRRIIYHFVNVKFGGILNTNRHPHPLSFAQGIQSDGRCVNCYYQLRYQMIFICLECKFAICYDCCKRFNT